MFLVRTGTPLIRQNPAADEPPNLLHFLIIQLLVNPFSPKSVFGISGQSGPAPELTTLDGGRLFLVRPDSVKGSRECIFIDASLSIRRTTHAHMYQLVVTRAFEEGEEQLLEEDAENSDERSFLLDSSLFLSLGPSLDPSTTSTASALSFTWLDPDGDGPDDEFEFVLPSDGSVSPSQAEEFERLCWKCMWERKEAREWPEDEREARRVEETLEDEFKVERAPHQSASSSLYPTLPPTTPPVVAPAKPDAYSSLTPATTSRLAPPVSSSKAPLFRATSPDAESDDDAPRFGQTTSSVLPDSDEEDAFDEARDGEDDSGDELAQQLMQKATIGGGGGSSKTDPSPAKGKGKAKAAPVPVEDAIATTMPRPPVAAAPSASSDNPAPVITVLASLHLYDRATGLFMLQDDSVRAGLYKLGPAGKGHWLVVESVGNEADVWVSQAITAETTVNFAEKEHAMVFNYTAPPADSDSDSQSQPVTYTWLLRLSTDEAFSALQASVSAALFEDKWGAGSWGKLKEDDREYARKAWLEEDAEMWDAEEDEGDVGEGQDEEEEEESEEEEPEPVVESDEDEYDSDDAPSASRAFTSKRPSRPPIGTKKRPKNSALAVGYKEDLSFVVQGDMIGVFKQQREGGKKLKFVTSIVNIATPDKKGFTPGKVMLHNQDTSMILQNPLAPGSLYRLDLETGKVVDEYKVSSDFSVSNFLPDSKFAQTTQQQTFIGLSHNGLFRIDPRLAGSKLVESEFKQYATKADFSAAATTESGRLAVASSKGDIRLFDKLGKNAKTALPALGDPIIGVDVSADGRWLLATCKTYLLLIDTMIPEASGSKFAGQLGFDRSFPAAEKPTPRRLTLKPEHVAHMQEVQGGEGVSFTPAKFNASLSGDPERTIVTSTGPFIVAWNFRQVKSGNTSNYTLRRFSEDVVADNFKFGGDREIIVTLPENVFVEEKKKLKAPTRESIVQTWDGL
ncbi:vacuolar import and degradation protein [Rhodotorula toruloides]|uniref:Vacuolar import and degradation protein n=1 Tax=Rhodotorula toruloides TaxID=5286 RepID=A0A511KGN4_RHOTO|nr:vacuolar import and degradation protein [Rhodotorula toruloides]